MESAIGYGSAAVAMFIDEGRESIVQGGEYLGVCHGVLLGVYPAGYFQCGA